MKALNMKYAAILKINLLNDVYNLNYRYHGHRQSIREYIYCQICIGTCAADTDALMMGMLIHRNYHRNLGKSIEI